MAEPVSDESKLAEARRPTKLDRFDSKVELGPGGCWLWTGPKNAGGYGRFHFKGKNYAAHRFSYEATNKRKIPDGLQLDHLCRNRACVNPNHLRPVTPRENTLAPGSLAVTAAHAAKERCWHGHTFGGERVRAGRGKERVCLKCKARWMRASRARKSGKPSWQDRAITAEAEVERLKAELAEARRLRDVDLDGYDRLQRALAKAEAELAKAREENERLKARVEEEEGNYVKTLESRDERVRLITRLTAEVERLRDDHQRGLQLAYKQTQDCQTVEEAVAALLELIERKEQRADQAEAALAELRRLIKASGEAAEKGIDMQSALAAATNRANINEGLAKMAHRERDEARADLAAANERAEKLESALREILEHVEMQNCDVIGAIQEAREALRPAAPPEAKPSGKL